MQIKSAKELEVYKKAYLLAMEIFELSKTFPLEERYALTSQIRRSSRSVSMNLREKHRRLVGVLDKPEVWSVAPKPRKARLSQPWAKRRYEAHFISKLTDCDGENSETDTSLDFAYDCGYISAVRHENLTSLCAEIGRMLGSMLRNPGPFLIKK
jgi:hypothetical protein